MWSGVRSDENICLHIDTLIYLKQLGKVGFFWVGLFLKSTIFLWQVGKGLSLDAKAQKLAFQHWIEAVSMIVLFFIIFCMTNYH